MIIKIRHNFLAVIFQEIIMGRPGKFRFTAWVLVSISIIFILASCGRSKSGTSKTATAPKEYGFITLAPQKTVIYSEFPATIQGQQNVEIRPKIDGYLEFIYVDEGSVVRKGQLLFKISAPIYEQGVRTAEAYIKIAQADLKAAEMQVNKVRPLVEKNIVSRFELDAAQYALQSKQAALAQARASLINATTNLSYATIYSPADGVIGIIPFKIGSLVSSTNAQPLTTVSNIRNVYAYFSNNEKQELNFLAHAQGNTLQEKIASLPPVTLVLANGSPYNQPGRIETIGGLVNVPTGSVSFRATFPNPTGLIRSGSSAIVRIPDTLYNALLIPQSATYQLQGKIFAYTIDQKDTIHSIAIQVNPITAGHAYVVEQGLKAGDRVVVEGVGNLSDGSFIKPKPLNTDSVYARY
jgi:membrane fusion protein, multidrug efflux system